MEFMGPYLTYAVAALIVLAALLIVLLVWRALSGKISGRRGSRLGVTEFHEIDKMRRLVLVRRDGVEHLVMIGGPQDLVIETNIDVADGSLGQQRIEPAATRSEPAFKSVDDGDEPKIPRPAPRPAVFGDRTPLRAVEPGRLFRDNQDG
jgi:Flagellar biosynthesis protein, FliO